MCNSLKAHVSGLPILHPEGNSDLRTFIGNFRRAATQQQSLAEVYELETGDSKSICHVS